MQMKMTKVIWYIYVMMNIIILATGCTLPGNATSKSDRSLVKTLRRSLKKYNKLLEPESYYKEAGSFKEEQCKLHNTSTVIEALFNDLDWVTYAKKELIQDARANKSADKQIAQANKMRELLCRLLNRSKSEIGTKMKISLISLKTKTISRANVYSFEFQTIRKLAYLLSCLKRTMKKKGAMLFKHDLSCKRTPSCRKLKKHRRKGNKKRKSKSKGRKQRKRKQKGKKDKGKKSKVIKPKQKKRRKPTTKNERNKNNESK